MSTDLRDNTERWSVLVERVQGLSVKYPATSHGKLEAFTAGLLLATPRISSRCSGYSFEPHAADSLQVQADIM